MCSVVGYIGTQLSRAFVLEGLQRLEYRGYDSAGFACIATDYRLLYAKAEGRLSNLQSQFELAPIDGYIGIGHTRWSTHGKPTSENAHPHFDCHKTISIVHNGIIENYHDIKVQLQKTGHAFQSETDTEVIAHLLEALLIQHTTLHSALQEMVNQLEGAYAFIGIMREFPDHMVLVRKRSPLCIGIGDNEMFVASDQVAFAGKTDKVLFLPDETYAIVTKETIQLYTFDGKTIPLSVQKMALNWVSDDKQGYDHYMIKEIYEQKGAIHATLDALKATHDTVWDQLNISAEHIKQLNKISLVGCGTSWHAARIAQFFFEYICMIPTQVYVASEFRYMPCFAEQHSLHLMISQSGETADTLEALRLVNSLHLPTVALTNVASSTMVREAQGFLLTRAGYEVAVASTKAFSTQLAALFWFAHRIALEKGVINRAQMEHAEHELLIAAEILENSIANYRFDITNTLAKKYAQYRKCIFLGRHVSYPFAMEAALKLKEISYIFAQCYPAGELKHGPLALIADDIPVFLFSHQDPILYQKILSNAQEVKARSGHLIVFAFEGQAQLIELADTAFIFPNINPLLGPLVMTGLMQFFIYQIAKELGCPIDKPRNLAKSVTVE